MNETPRGTEIVRLAIVDDHELVRDGLASLLSNHNSVDIDIVFNGVDPKLAAEFSPDVVLLDVNLGADFPNVAENVSASAKTGARVLLLSAFVDPIVIRSALAAGALGYVPKRASSEMLCDAIETAYRSEFYLSVDLASMLASAVTTPDLSPRELDALRLYSSGLKLSAVAHRMGISPHTAKEYLDRVRAKYAAVGRSARTRTELYQAAQHDGLIPRDGTPWA